MTVGFANVMENKIFGDHKPNLICSPQAIFVLENFDLIPERTNFYEIDLNKYSNMLPSQKDIFWIREKFVRSLMGICGACVNYPEEAGGILRQWDDNRKIPGVLVLMPNGKISFISYEDAKYFKEVK